MPLEVIELRDTRVFTQDYTNTVLVKNIANDVSTGYNFTGANGAYDGTRYMHSAYDMIRDRITYLVTGEKQISVGIRAIESGIASFDALMRNASIGAYRTRTQLTGGGSFSSFYSGQPNLQTGQQKIYGFENSDQHFELNTLDNSKGALDIWPNVVSNFSASVASTGTAGYFSARGVSVGWNITVFEGITDTTGFSEAIIGGSSHPKGLALINVAVTNLDGGANTDERFAWIDLDTGNCVGVLNIPVLANSGSANLFAEPSVGGFDFVWHKSQFVPDVGSTFANPKGELHVFSQESGNATYDSSTSIVAPGSTFTSVAKRQFVAVYDFNPFGDPAGTVRIHNRRIFLGVFDIPFEPIIAGGISTVGTGGAYSSFSDRGHNTFYHPPSRTYVNHVGNSSGPNSVGPDDPVALTSRIIRFRRAFAIGGIGQPVPETAVTENRTIRARVDALSDIGARAVGVNVAFTLHKVSTRDENFDGTALGAGTFTVATDEIDEDGYLEVRSGGGVDDEPGPTMLDETTDYTVAYATGVLTPVGSWPSAQIHVRWRHRSVRVGTGHGTLLVSQGTTDANGIAFAHITYGTNLAGELDECEAVA